MAGTLKRLLPATLLLLPYGAQAHEIGTTMVRLTLHRDHSWTAFIITASQTLLDKLEA
jgi:hypothetical protein